MLEFLKLETRKGSDSFFLFLISFGFPKKNRYYNLLICGNDTTFSKMKNHNICPVLKIF